MEAKKSPKIPKIFECQCCNYNTSNKKDYNKHLLTAKHKKETDGNIKNPYYICEFCNKQYRSRGSCWKHQQKCDKVPYTQEKPQEIPAKTSDSQLIIELLQQNQELQKQLIEAVKTGGHHIENQTINNNNQKFNLNFFLNEQCKDAINMSDFIENMELDLEDLTETGRLGYVGGISRILINKLQELDIYKRPLHCTDVKRETLYIKENDEWEKQANSKDKMGQIIGKVANKNCRNLPKWTEEHPGYEVFDSPENMEYMNMTQAILGGYSEEENKQFKDKIIRSVIKEVMVNK
jgi:hypothetical protein